MKHLIFTSTLMVIEYKQHSDSQTVNTRIPYSWNVIVLQKKKPNRVWENWLASKNIY